jgi:uncharacterized membrane protein
MPAPPEPERRLLADYTTAEDPTFVAPAVTQGQAPSGETSAERPGRGARPRGARRRGAGAKPTGSGRRDRVSAPPARPVRRHIIMVVFAIVLMATLLSVLSVQKYRRYDDARFDLGNMVQAVDNTAHGHFLEVTGTDGRQMSRLGAHADPVLAVFAVPWLVWPSPLLLLLGQAVIVCLAAWPAYRLGLRILGDSRAALLGALALLLYPPLEYAVLNEFHPVTLAIPLLLFAFLYLDEDRLLLATPFLVLAALCKEEVPLVIACMGVYFALRKRSWRPLLITVAASAYFGVAVGVVLPHFHAGGSPFVGRYSAYGSSMSEVARNLLFKPRATFHGLGTRLNARYAWRLLWPFSLASLASPLTTLIALPEYLLNGLASVQYQHLITFHYVAAEVPFLFAGALLGVARVARWIGRLVGLVGGSRRAQSDQAQSNQAQSNQAQSNRTQSRRVAPAHTVAVLTGVVLCAALAGNYVLGPLPFGLPGAKVAPHRYRVTAHAAVIDRAIRLIPANAVVSAENGIGSHLSARRVIYVFPYVGNAQYVVTDARKTWYYDSRDKIGLARRAAIVAALAKNPRYVSVFSTGGVTVYRRVR